MFRECMRCFEIRMEEEEEEVRQRSMFKILFFLSRKDCLFLFLLSRRNETEDNDYNPIHSFSNTLSSIYICLSLFVLFSTHDGGGNDEGDDNNGGWDKVSLIIVNESRCVLEDLPPHPARCLPLPISRWCKRCGHFPRLPGRITEDFGWLPVFQVIVRCKLSQDHPVQLTDRD